MEKDNSSTVILKKKPFIVAVVLVLILILGVIGFSIWQLKQFQDTKNDLNNQITSLKNQLGNQTTISPAPPSTTNRTNKKKRSKKQLSPTPEPSVTLAPTVSQ